uniref:Uncharacterized protein n=1 Tax=Glossina pallidipes TaxID=7398 RepID=A0A1A9Z4Z8_GLOPL
MQQQSSCRVSRKIKTSRHSLAEFQIRRSSQQTEASSTAELTDFSYIFLFGALLAQNERELSPTLIRAWILTRTVIKLQKSSSSSLATTTTTTTVEVQYIFLCTALYTMKMLFAFLLNERTRAIVLWYFNSLLIASHEVVLVLLPNTNLKNSSSFEDQFTFRIGSFGFATPVILTLTSDS